MFLCDVKVGGVETDMVALSQAVESCGGIQQVIDKNKWPKVAEMIRIPTVVSVHYVLKGFLGPVYYSQIM